MCCAGTFYVACKDCDAESAKFRTEKTVVARWNRRALAPSPGVAGLVGKWRKWADGLYRAEPANRIRDCADELEVALTAAGPAVGEDAQVIEVLVAGGFITEAKVAEARSLLRAANANPADAEVGRG